MTREITSEELDEMIELQTQLIESAMLAGADQKMLDDLEEGLKNLKKIRNSGNTNE